MTKNMMRYKVMVNLKWWIDYRGLSQQQFADMCGVSKSTISRYICGERVPDLVHMYSMARVLGCRIEDIIEG